MCLNKCLGATQMMEDRLLTFNISLSLSVNVIFPIIHRCNFEDARHTVKTRYLVSVLKNELAFDIF